MEIRQGWPKFMFSAVQLQPLPPKPKDTLDATGKGGPTIVVSGYAPSVSTLPDGNVVTISGTYPFSDTVRLPIAKSFELLRTNHTDG